MGKTMRRSRARSASRSSQASVRGWSRRADRHAMREDRRQSRCKRQPRRYERGVVGAAVSVAIALPAFVAASDSRSRLAPLLQAGHVGTILHGLPVGAAQAATAPTQTPAQTARSRTPTDLERHSLARAPCIPNAKSHTKKKPAISRLPASQYGAPGRIRTSDPQVRSLVLYPAELRALSWKIMAEKLHSVNISMKPSRRSVCVAGTVRRKKSRRRRLRYNWRRVRDSNPR